MRTEPTTSPTTEVICLGEALVDLVATGQPGTLLEAATFVRSAGGAPLNVAVGLARLGRRSGFVGRVGTDAFGDLLHATLAREGVDAVGLSRDPEARTTLAFIAEDTGGRREILFYRHPGADARLTLNDRARALLGAARVLHVGTLSLSSEPARSATLAAIDLARIGGALISCDVNLRQSLWPDRVTALEWMRRLLTLADVAKLSEEEMAFVTGTDDLRVGPASVHALGPTLVVITRGAEGSLLTTASGEWSTPGLIVPTVDTTGAGDGFMAGLLTGLLALGCPPERLDALPPEAYRHLLLLANAVGALTTTRHGAIPALPTAAETRAFLTERGAPSAVVDLLNLPR